MLKILSVITYSWNAKMRMLEILGIRNLILLFLHLIEEVPKPQSFKMMLILKNSLNKFFKEVFNLDQPHTHSDLDLLLMFYKNLDKNLINNLQH